MKTTIVTCFFALVVLALLPACSAPQHRGVVLDSDQGSARGVCPNELSKIANDVQDPESARAAIRQYLECRKLAKVPEPPMAGEVRDALDRNPWTAIRREPSKIAAHFFDSAALRKAPSNERLDDWVQMLRDQRLVAEANGDADLVAAIDAWIEKGEFALYVKNLGHKAPK